MRPCLAAALIAALALSGCGDDSSSAPPGAGLSYVADARPEAGPADAVVDASPDATPDVYVRDALPTPDFGAPGPESPSAELQGVITEQSALVSLYARNLTSGQAVAVAADTAVAGYHRFFVVLTYASQVAAGTLDPEEQRELTALFLRHGGRLSMADVGMSFKLSQLASLTLLSDDATAEELLLAAVGGKQMVDATISALGIDAIGEYLGPCGYDRALANTLDARFANVACEVLAAWMRNDDSSGLTPSPFDAPPEFSEGEMAAAWDAVWSNGFRTGTARAWGEILTRLHLRTLVSGEVSDIMRDLLDRALGSGGGGDALPPEAWVGNLSKTIFRGRHWLAVVRGGAAPYIVVIMTHDELGSADATGFFHDVSRLAYEQVVGPINVNAAVASPFPAWLRAIIVLLADDSQICNEQHANDLESLITCRQAAQRATFQLDEQSAATVIVEEAPTVDVAWFWTEPDGLRHRYQVRLDEGGWWVWTRSFPCQVEGNWRLDVYANGVPHLVQSLTVNQ